MKTPVSARLDKALPGYLDACQKAHATRALQEHNLKHAYALAIAEREALDDRSLRDKAGQDGLERPSVIP